jgi:hypothetical protein
VDTGFTPARANTRRPCTSACVHMGIRHVNPDASIPSTAHATSCPCWSTGNPGGAGKQTFRLTRTVFKVSWVFQRLFSLQQQRTPHTAVTANSGHRIEPPGGRQAATQGFQVKARYARLTFRSTVVSLWHSAVPATNGNFPRQKKQRISWTTTSVPTTVCRCVAPALWYQLHGSTAR